MLELKGKYNTAKVFTDNVDNETISEVMPESGWGRYWLRYAGCSNCRKGC